MFFYISLSVCLGCCVCCFSSCEQLHAHVCLFGICLFGGLVSNCWRPYHVECTGSLLTSEVKRHRARLVLGWGTAWEDLRVLPAPPSQTGTGEKEKGVGRGEGRGGGRGGGRGKGKGKGKRQRQRQRPAGPCLCLCLFSIY